MNFSPLVPSPGALEHIRVSIVIPVFNEEKVIAECLQSLTQLDAPRDSYEVILVDNGSIDRTVERARPFAAQLNLTLLQKTGVHVSAVRNFGAAKARGEILAFLDSDCAVSPSWLKQSMALLAQEGVGIAGAHFRIPDNSRWVARAWYGDLSMEKQGDVAWVPGCNTWLKRALFERLHGFDESIQTNEDCEFCDRVRAAGLRVISDSSIAVVHLETPQTLWEFYTKICWHATDGLHVFIRDLPKISNARPLLFGLYTLICSIGIAVGILFTISRYRFDILEFFVGALLLPSFLMSLKLVLKRKKWGQLLPLTVMHLVYGAARGQAFLKLRSWTGSRKGKGA